MTLIAIRLIEVNDQKVTTKGFVSFAKLKEYAHSKSGSVVSKDGKKFLQNELKEEIESKK